MGLYHNRVVKIAARMALIATVVGTATAVAATGRITLSLVLSGALMWSAVPVVQLLTGLLLVRGAPTRTSDALELYLRTHRAWSIWLLLCAAALILVPQPISIGLYAAATFIIPGALTVRMLVAFCRWELGFSRTAAMRRVLLHQVVTSLVLLSYGNYAGALIERISGRAGL